jgi:hypothetical protein
MPDEVVMVSSCPLCLGPDEVLSMVTVEIDRIIPKGRVAILLCRSCARAVIQAGERVELELAEIPPWLDRMNHNSIWSTDTWSAVAQIYGAFGEDPAWFEEQSAREKKESDDDTSTD